MLLFSFFNLFISCLLILPVYTVFINGGLDPYTCFIFAFFFYLINTSLSYAYYYTNLYSKYIKRKNKM